MQSSGDKTKGNNLDTTSKFPPGRPLNGASERRPKQEHRKQYGGANGTAAPKDRGMSQSGMSQTDATRPDFSTLDTKKTGERTAADVKSNQWLSKNFSKCDTDHDGSLDKAEYSACH
jgi:hypothetical protein